MIDVQIKNAVPQVNNSDKNFITKTVVKIGRKHLDAEEYVRKIELEIAKNFLDNPAEYSHTYNYARAQLADFEFKQSQETYSKIIQKCFRDIDEAVLNGAPQAQVDKLVNVLETFMKKYGHFAK